MEKDCLFCKIITGRIGVDGLFWEDKSYMAWLAIDPNTEGFSVVVPKKHFRSDVLKMDDKNLKEFIIAAKKVSGILEKAFDDVGRVGLVMEGTGINHAHIKLIPMHNTKWMKEGKWMPVPSNKSDYFDSYEGYLSSAAGPLANPNDLKKLAKKLSSI
ncbi:MAG: HIT family protein [Bifidobacteriaceae bacterium]|jgi:diadenosine tetraphosphate (Ap4A) HIT family hydrolase|nr:HIT family protein [Bifidobacteriaceae bacterium]